MGIMSLTEIMDRSIDILKKYIKTILLFTIGYGIIIMVSIIALFIALFIMGSILVMVGNILNGEWGGLVHSITNGLPVKILMGTSVSVLGIFVAALSVSSNVGIIKICSQEFLEEEVYAEQAISVSFKSIFKIFGIIGMAIIMFLPILGIFTALGYFFYKSTEYSTILFGIYNTKEILLVIFPVLFFIAIILVIAAYITVLSFSLQALVIEKKGIFGALKRSYTLVKNNFWRIFGYFILFSLTIYGIKISLSSFFGVTSTMVYFFLKFLNIHQNYNTFIKMMMTIFQWPLNILSWALISPIASIMISLLYYNQRFMKEGYDIELKLKEIGKSEERKLNESVECKNTF